ncbi:hypothetical protein [Hydrogenimonas sp.]
MFEMILYVVVGILMVTAIALLYMTLMENRENDSFKQQVAQGFEEVQKTGIAEIAKATETASVARPSSSFSSFSPSSSLPEIRFENHASVPSNPVNNVVSDTTEPVNKTAIEEIWEKKNAEEEKESEKIFEPEKREPAPIQFTFKEERRRHSAVTKKRTNAAQSKFDIANIEKDYGHFTHQRLIDEMGLSTDEVYEYIAELISELDIATKELDEAINANDFEKVERITFELKGAALNIGNGGITALLIDYHNHVKNGTNPLTVRIYQKLFKKYVNELLCDYFQVA